MSRVGDPRGLRARFIMIVVKCVLTSASLALLAGAASGQAARDTTSRPRPAAASVVPADSLPSAEARAVLRTIPEPLAPNEMFAARDSVAGVPPTNATPDTAAADTSGVPTPEPTAPLGEGPGGPVRRVFSDTLASATPGSATSAPGVAPVAGSPPARASVLPSMAITDTCWRVQIAAPLDAEEAEAKRAAAESQLLVVMVIETEQGRHRVRSKDCLPRAAAEAVKARALLSGFDGAFLVRMGPGGVAIPAAAPARKAAATRSGTVGTTKPVQAKRPAANRKSAPTKHSSTGGRSR